MYEKLTESLRKCGRLNMGDECICFHDGCCEAEPTCMYELMRKAADVVEELSKPRWIPVTERLPEEGVSVQVCFRSQGGIAQAVSERFVNDRNQSYWSGLCGRKPTHWMPLPSTEGLNET